MVGNDMESATIEQALVFYQQHLVLERQKQENHLPRNGKSAATPEDVSRDHTFERQLQTIAAILASRKRSPNPSLGDITLPKPTNSPPQPPKWNEPDSDPYINPITGQWIVPETPFTPGPSNSGSVSNEWGLVKGVKSITIIDNPPSRNDTVPSTLHTISKPADRKVNAPESSNQSKLFKPSPITRKPVNSSQPTRQNFVVPPAELSFPSTPDDLSLATSKPPANPYLLAKNATTRAAFGWESENESEESFGEQVVSSLRARSADPKLATVNPGSLDLPKPLHIDKQRPRPAESQDGQGTPWTFVTKPMAMATERIRPAIPTTSQQSRELAWNSATPSQKPGTPISAKSQQSQETSWGVVNPNCPTLGAKVMSTGHPAASQGNRKPSWSSVSTAELDGRLTFVATHQSPQLSRPPILPDHPMTATESTLRQQPAFNPAELGKFPGEHGVGSTFALPGRSEESGHGPGIARTRLSDGLNPFSSLRFANDPSIPAKAAQFSSVMPNDPRQPFISSSQTIRPNQIQSLSNNPTEQIEKDDETPGTEVDNALRLAAGVAQQFASFSAQAEPSRGFSPNNFSALFGSGHRPFHERHLDSTRPSGNVSQSQCVPFQMENLNMMSVQGVGPFSAGQDLPNRLSQNHHAFGPLGGQNGIVPNQLKPLGFEPENRHSADQRFGQPMMNDRPRGNERFTEAQFISQDTDDVWMAQIIADRADRAELDALQRMQDEWNREDDVRLAKQQEVARRLQDEWNNPYAQGFGGQQRHSHLNFQSQARPDPRQREWSRQSQDQFAGPPVSRRVPTPWNPSRQGSEDSIQFAPAPGDDALQPAISRDPQKPSPKAQRLTPAQRNFDAAKAAEEEILKYEAAHREREEKAKQTQLEKDKADKATKANQANCTVCGDPGDKAKMAVLACAHAYDGDCIAQAFQHALAGGKLFHCCNKTPVPIDLAAPFLSAQFVTTYKAKMVELATPNPIYCAAPGCSTFIPTSGIKGDMSTCPACSFVTCRLCKNPEHRGLCPPDKNGKKLLDLASNKNWRQCRRCNVVVERDEGCLHITCTCGYEFCYSCGGLWSQCGGKCPRSY